MKYLRIIIISFILYSCSNKIEISKFDDYDIATTVRLSQDTTTIIIKDYFPLCDNLDSVTSSSLEIIGDKTMDTIQIVRTKKTKKLNIINLSTNKGEGVIVVLDYCQHNNSGNQVYTVTKEFNKNKVTAEIFGNNAEFIVLWQNRVIDPFYIEVKNENKKTSLNIEIPSSSKNFERSFIRIFSSGSEQIANDVLIPLNFGEVIESSFKIRREDKHAQVMYSLLIDRFFDGDPSNSKKLNSPNVLPKVDYFGGDLKGVLEKIKSGFFNNLGINTIWLSPITQNPYDAWGQYSDPSTQFSGYHGYWPIYLTKIDRRFGDEKVLKELLSEAHARDINVILDYVANHLHIDSPVLKENKDWTTSPITPDGRPNFELWDEFRLTTWFDKHIPSLDLEKEYVNEPLTDSALFWMVNYDFDGFRHDATKHIPEVFWRKLTQKIANSLPDKNIYQIGETYGSPSLINSYVRNGMLDGQFDFNVYDSFIWSVINNDGSFVDVMTTLIESLNTYGYHNLMGYITGNHDRPRFISLAGGALLPDEDWKKAGWNREIGVGKNESYDYLSILHAFIFTIPGIPTVYYGDEFGDPGANDPDNRRWMRFDNYNEHEAKLLNNFVSLSKFRRSSIPLIYGDFIPLKAEEDILAYLRVYMGKIVLIAINKSNDIKEVEIKIPFDFEGKKFQLQSGRILSLDDYTITVEIEPRNFVLINN